MIVITELYFIFRQLKLLKKMSLFQKTVITKYVSTIDTQDLEQKWQVFAAYFLNPTLQQNIRSLKEEQFQEGFLRELFVKVFGYVLSPNEKHNLITEQKNVTNSKKADGAILVNGKVVGVIELKGTDTTDLNKIETQAFGYKNNQPNCSYVITSNFEKLRFYIDNAVEHIEFNLFTLSKEEFTLLYLILDYKNIEKEIPQKLKKESISEETKVTKELYKDYSTFKRELHSSLVALNPNYNALLLFKKSQKLLDRFLFLFFAEDRALLPPNSVRLVLSDWKELIERDVEVPLYNRFKKYFGYLNTGFKGARYDVYPYNGGLFKPDVVLDTIQIDDTILYKHTKKLAAYDFESEVDVNILGHIFENSLNEIEEVQATLEGQTIDKTASKRKKDGVFYTPKYITKYIVENTVGTLCTAQKEVFDITDEAYQPATKRSRKKIDNLQAYRSWLLQLTICDPACGSGAFLNEALNFLIAEHKYVDELSAKYNRDTLLLSDVENSILEHNLFGVDLNEESVEIAKLSLWLRTAKPNRKLNSLNNNIKCGNSLIEDATIAGDKAFDWAKEFPQVFSKGGFDVIIGNPPYVRQELFKDYANYLKKYHVYSGKADLFTYFFEKAHNILKTNGYLSFISSGKFFEANYGKPLVKYLVENFIIKEVINFDDLDVFEGISAYPLIFTGTKKKPNKDYIFNYCFMPDHTQNNISEIVLDIPFTKVNITDFINFDYNFYSRKVAKLFKKINKDSIYLEDLNLMPLVGVKTGFNDGFTINKNTSNSKPYIFGKNIKRYLTLASENIIIFPYERKENLYQLINEENLKEESEYLLLNRSKLEKRAIIKDGIKNGSKKWFEYQQINRKLDFDTEYIVYPNVSLGTNFTLSKGNIIDMTGFIIPSNNKYLLCLLNSKISQFVMKKIAISRRGGYNEYKVQYLSKIPLKEISEKQQEPFINKAEEMLTLNKELQEVSSKFQRTLQRKFEVLEKLPKKLENWYELSFADFVKELKKKKIKLSLAEEADWEDYFLTEQPKATSLEHRMQTLDATIDQMVYALYGLTADEIAIVEAG